MPRRARPLRSLPVPDQPSVPVGQAAALDAALDQTLVRSLGALPLLLPLCDQLGLREVVNRRCYPDGTVPEDIDVGRVALVLVLNRLLAPQPLVHVERWLTGTVLPDLRGLSAAQCNDDRLARTLDTLLPHLDALWQDLIVAALTRFDLDLSALCYDLTSLSFCGAYEQADLIRYGYSRAHRPDRKQVEVAATVTAAGGVPLDYHVLAGNVADRTTPVENLRRLRGLLAQLPPRDPTQSAPVVVSDRAMLTPEALAAYADADWHPLGPLDPHRGDGAVQDLLASVPAEELAAAPLAYRPQRAVADLDWEDYHGVERALEVPHPVADRPPLALRALVVWSPGKARLDAQVRATHLARLEAARADLAGKIGRRPYTTTAAVHKRVRTLLAHHPARHFVAVTLQGGPEAAAPLTLTWARQDQALTGSGNDSFVEQPFAPSLLADICLRDLSPREHVIPMVKYDGQAGKGCHYKVVSLQKRTEHANISQGAVDRRYLYEREWPGCGRCRHGGAGPRRPPGESMCSGPPGRPGATHDDRRTDVHDAARGRVHLRPQPVWATGSE